MVGCRPSRLNQNKPFSGPVSTLMSSSAEFYSFSLSGRLRAVGLGIKSIPNFRKGGSVKGVEKRAGSRHPLLAREILCKLYIICSPYVGFHAKKYKNICLICFNKVSFTGQKFLVSFRGLNKNF